MAAFEPSEPLEPSQKFSVHAVKTYRVAATLAKHPAYLDAEIACKDGVVKANRLILCAKSVFIRQLLKDKSYDGRTFYIIAPEETVAIVQLVVNCMVDGEEDIPEDAKQEFENLLKKWQVDMEMSACMKKDRKSSNGGTKNNPVPPANPASTSTSAVLPKSAAQAGAPGVTPVRKSSRTARKKIAGQEDAEPIAVAGPTKKEKCQAGDRKAARTAAKTPQQQKCLAADRKIARAASKPTQPKKPRAAEKKIAQPTPKTARQQPQKIHRSNSLPEQPSALPPARRQGSDNVKSWMGPLPTRVEAPSPVVSRPARLGGKANAVPAQVNGNKKSPVPFQTSTPVAPGKSNPPKPDNNSDADRELFRFASSDADEWTFEVNQNGQQASGSMPSSSTSHSAVLIYHGSPSGVLPAAVTQVKQNEAQKRSKNAEDDGNCPPSKKPAVLEVRPPMRKKFPKHPAGLEEDLVRADGVIWIGRTLLPPNAKQYVCEVCGSNTANANESDFEWMKIHVNREHPDEVFAQLGLPPRRCSSRVRVCGCCKQKLTAAQDGETTGHSIDCSLKKADRKDKKTSNGAEAEKA